MTPRAASQFAAAALRAPSASSARPLSGGHLNQVWRVDVGETSVVVKHAPPFAATAPDISLDPSRIDFEARALELFNQKGKLRSLVCAAIRPPELLAFDSAAHAIVMEDIGDGPALGTLLQRVRDVDAELSRLGEFIGTLHRTTAGDPELARRFDNAPIQETRFRLQYEAVGPLLTGQGLGETVAGLVGARAAQLGVELGAPGRCLVMGDLWPASVVVDGPSMRLIDWEFCHYGRALQDVAHLAAHLWMHADRAATERARRAVRRGLRIFVQAYRGALGGLAQRLWSDDERRAGAIHVGCEIIMRTLGPFRHGGLYDGMGPADSRLAGAVRFACACIRDRAFFEGL